MLRSIAVTLALVAGLAALTSPSSACDGGKTLLEDRFEAFNPAWGFELYPAMETIQPNGYVADFPPNTYRRGISQLGTFKDYVACATFAINFTCTDKDKCESQPYAGIIVLAADAKNFYSFDVSPAYGSYSLSRLQDDKWQTAVGWTYLPDNKKLLSAERFELEAIVTGSSMSFKLNGKTVLSFDGEAPAGGSLVGFEIGNYDSDTKNSRFTLSRFVVRELQ